MSSSSFPFSNSKLYESYNRYTKYQVDNSNAADYQQNDRSIVFSQDQNEPKSVLQEPEIIYQTKESFLVVSSHDRDHTLFPNTNSFQIHLKTEYKNIKSIELIQAIVPNQNEVGNEPYLVLQIDEIDDVMDSNDDVISKGFALMGLAPSSGPFLYLDKCIHENTVKYYTQPKASLDRMTISIKSMDGTLFDFGADSEPPLKNKLKQTTFIFKIQTLEKTRSPLNHRNLFY